MKIVTVVGTRPQLVKASALTGKWIEHPGVQEILVDTGQHFDKNMSKIFYEELNLPYPHYFLDVHGGSHGAQTAHMLERIEQVLQKEEPEAVIVYGDTNSTLAGALAAVKLSIPVFHIEAGLRSGNMRMPEEVNRKIVDHISDMLFVPSQKAACNLKMEGIDQSKVHSVGDIMYDVALYHEQRANNQSKILEKLTLTEGHYILMTVHRAANADNRQTISTLYEAAAELGKTIPVVWIMHPRTKKTFSVLSLQMEQEGLRIIEPIGYLDMVKMEKNAKLIMTDSGGVQKEAYFHGVPCVILRPETEWVELVEKGYSLLCPTIVVPEITRQAQNAMNTTISKNEFIYGDGHTVDRIINLILSRYM